MLATSLVICGKTKVLSCCTDSDKSKQNRVSSGIMFVQSGGHLQVIDLFII